MKFFFITLISVFFLKITFAQGYQITLQAPYYKSGIVYLTYYMGNSLSVVDSTAFNSAGTAIFKGPDKLLGGIYAIVFPGKELRTEFLLDKEQIINIKADISDLLNKTVVTGSKENILYEQYQKFVAGKGKLLQQEQLAYKASKTKKDSLLHEKNYNDYNSQLNNYREGIIKNYSTSLLAVLLTAMKEPPVPSLVPITLQDSISNYNFYKKNYWNGITFMDDRIIRTPFFLRKLENYYREIIPQVADSIIKDADYRLLLARSSPEMYKFLLNWLTDEYINHKYMGLDAVFVHLFNKYHSKGISNWLNEDQMETISRRAYMLMANLIGDKGADLEMVDSTGIASNLYNLNADFVVVCFWDPNCGHCREELPRLDSIYQASWKKHNVKIYAVLSPDEKENVKTDWTNFIKKHNLADWTHVYQTKEMENGERSIGKANYRQLYDITSTPTLYLLDKDKRIVGKKLTILQLHELLELKWKTNSN